MTLTPLHRAFLLSAALLTSVAGAYTVKPGDTLFSLARASGTTVADLMRLNDLSSTTLEVGQTLRLPGEAAPSASPAPASPLPLPPAPALPGVNVTAPTSLRMGDAFALRLTGPRAAEARVHFPSEVGEDVRLPAERLTPVPAGNGTFIVLGRVLLGKATPLIYEIELDGQVLRRSLPVAGLPQPVQRLNLPPSISGKLQDPARAAEDAAVERAYALRTPSVWTKPFQDAVQVRAQSSAFGQPRTYVAGGPVQYHYGTDYRAPAGTAVRAVNDGTVVMAGMYPVRGGLVILDHGAGVTSLYFHQRRVTVKVGQKVSRGDKIGEVGSTGLSTGPHLHLELRVRGEGTDPAGWMNRLWPK
ncbi:LysM peptidoglycan-binding domain-containing M23 family metallopeptidase [Deinococcus sp. PEB2-63]